MPFSSMSPIAEEEYECYAIVPGYRARRPLISFSKDETEQISNRYPGTIYQYFQTLDEARIYLKCYGFTEGQYDVMERPPEITRPTTRDWRRNTVPGPGGTGLRSSFNDSPSTASYSTLENPSSGNMTGSGLSIGEPRGASQNTDNPWGLNEEELRDFNFYRDYLANYRADRPETHVSPSRRTNAQFPAVLSLPVRTRRQRGQGQGQGRESEEERLLDNFDRLDL